MKKFLLSIAVMAAMIVGSLAVPSTAEARPWGYRGGYYGGRAYYGGYGYGYRPSYGGYYGYRPSYGGYYAPRYYNYYGYPGYYGYPRSYYGNPGYYRYGYYPGFRAGAYVY
jgi:hypothetical protein